MKKYFFYTIINFLFVQNLALAQTQEDFTNKFSEVHLNQSDSVKARAAALEAYDMLESTEELQTIGNYSMLVAIFRDQVKDKELEEICQQKVNAQIDFSSSQVQKPATYDTPEVEWVYEYQLPFYQKPDSKLGNKALKFLDANPEIKNYTNYSAVANFYENLGDFKKAEELYDKALGYINYDNKEIISIYGQAYFYLKSGQYERIDELLAINNRLKEGAEEYAINSYELIDNMIQMIYYVSTGDYFNYITASDKFYDYMAKTYPDPNGGATYKQAYHSNRGLGFESIGDWKLADENWALADEAKKQHNRQLKEQYPNFPTQYLSVHDLYLAKRGELKDRQKAIMELDEYYDKLEVGATLQPQLSYSKGLYLGHYRDRRYKSLYADLIGNGKLLKDFTQATQPLAYLAFFNMRDGDFKVSRQNYNQLFKSNLDWINDIIFSFGEKAFVAYYNTKLKEGYDNYHSFVRLAREKDLEDFSNLSMQAYNNLLLTKSIAFKSVRKRKKAFLNSNSPETIKHYEEWIAKKQELIRLYQLSQSDQQDMANLLTPNSSQQTKPQKTIDRDSLELLQKEVNDLENSLASESKNFEVTLKIASPDWKAVRRKLKPGEAAVEVVRFDWRDQIYYSDSAYYAAYIIKHDSKYPEVIYLPTLARSLDARYYQFYRNSIRLKTNDNTSYQQYWLPLKEALPDIKKVYFSPDGIYHLINLPTLRNPADNQYLIDEIEIDYVTSTANIGNTSSTNKLSSAVLIGRPQYALSKSKISTEELTTRSFGKNFRNANITDLPGTESEVNGIKDQLEQEGISVKQLIGEMAIEDEVYKLQSPDILHIATHGFWSQTEGTTTAYRVFNAMVNSGLLLAGVVDYYSGVTALQHDGILTAYEAQGIDLEGTELVILSACETGLGEFDAGEGVYGLQRAFRAAGAKSVITSLWKVDDQGTKDFMVSFYRHLIQLKDKSAAFTKAQQEIKMKYKDPYYWGAFVLMGG